MAEIVAIYILCRNIGTVARARGVRAAPFQMQAAILWVVFELVFMVGAGAIGMQGLLLYLAGFTGALFSMTISFHSVRTAVPKRSARPGTSSEVTSDPRHSGSSTLRWLDDNMISCAEKPGEAYDWILTLEPDDWPLLQRMWPDRPAAWREACACIAGLGPALSTQDLLHLALADKNHAVAIQGAVSLCSHLLAQPPQVLLDNSLVPRLRELRNCDPELELVEVDEVLRRIDAPT